ncbi:MAG: DUF2029 domain-containing protein [Chloroflexi bacterium]|nr:DUF2029 domain-containing protein [Chloroflexota bacterium]
MIATRPADSPALKSAPERVSTHIVRLLLLVCAGVVMQVGWTMVWTLSYRLTHGNDFTYTLLTSQPAMWQRLMDQLVLANTLAPGLEVPPFQGPDTLDIVVNSLVFAFAITGVGYLCAIILIDLGIAAVRGAALIIVLFEVVYQVTLYLTPGLFTTDIFSYVMYGRISAVYDLNPYIYPPNYFPGDQMLSWIHPIWHDQPSVYGPLWTALGWIMAHLIAPFDGLVDNLPDGQVLQTGLMDQVFAYKLLMNVVQVANLALVWWLLGRIMASKPRARLAAFVVFAWNPLMLFDTAGNAHNDALMVTLLLLGFVPLVARERAPSNISWLAGIFGVGLSALIKYTTGLVGVFMVVAWARRLVSWPARVVWIGGAGVLLALASAVFFLPWLDSGRALAPILVAAGGKYWMYSNWAPDLLALTLSDQWLDPSGLTAQFPDVVHEPIRAWFKLICRAIFAVYIVWELVRLWRIAGDHARSLIEPILVASVRAFIVMILVYFTWVLEWYWMWPLALATLLGWHRMLTKVVVGYTLTSLPIFYVHHYWSSNMPGGLVLAYALPPLLLPLLAWAYSRWVRRLSASVSVKPVFRRGLEAASE